MPISMKSIASYITRVRAIRVSNDITVQINVATVNDPPVATIIFGDSNQNMETPSRLPRCLTIPTLMIATPSPQTPPAPWVRSLSGDGTFSYDPNGKFESLAVGATAFDTFIFTVIDSSGVSSTATAKITIHGENDAPGDIARYCRFASRKRIRRMLRHGVLANDHDPDLGDTLSVAAITFGPTTKAIPLNSNVTMKGTYGDLTIDSDGSYSYAAGKAQPSQGLAQDSFSYTAIDAHGGATRASLTIAITNNTYVIGSPGATLTGGTGKQVLDGSLGQQTIVGGNGKDVLIAGPSDVLTGGNGPDTFVFRSGFGHVTIADFDTHIDVLQSGSRHLPDNPERINPRRERWARRHRDKL